MFYLFEIAYKFKLKDDAPFFTEANFYELTHVIAENIDDVNKTILDIYTKRNILEYKLLKMTPLTSPMLTYSTAIPERIYTQFECLKD